VRRRFEPPDELPPPTSKAVYITTFHKVAPGLLCKAIGVSMSD